MSSKPEEIRDAAHLLGQVETEIDRGIVGQADFVRGLLIGVAANGHLLIEGVPGLAKTRAVNLLARICKLEFKRIQFTPDLLPADVIGTRIYNQSTASFETSRGPIFANFVLADEINRAPAKVQSALLETMEERQVTIGRETLKLQPPFLVFATQNPIEQEGTYPLPEAQLDRFGDSENESESDQGGSGGGEGEPEDPSQGGGGSGGGDEPQDPGQGGGAPPEDPGDDPGGGSGDEPPGEGEGDQDPNGGGAPDQPPGDLPPPPPGREPGPSGGGAPPPLTPDELGQIRQELERIAQQGHEPGKFHRRTLPEQFGKEHWANPDRVIWW